MPTSQLKRYEQILQAMLNAVVARTDLSDLTDASVFKHLLAGPAREMDEIYYQLALIPDRWNIDTAVGDDLDQRATEIQPALLFRQQATKATGSVVFSRTGTVGTTVIPVGTTVKTVDGKSFETTAVATIADTFTAAPAVAAIAVLGGASGNVAPNTITQFEAKPPGVNFVNNPASFATGSDKETDDAFRDRLKAFLRTLARCTPEALEFISRSVVLSNGQRVVYSHVFEDPIFRGEVILYVDDGSGTAETVVVIAAENVTAGLGGPPPNSAVGGEEFLSLNNKPVKPTVPVVITSAPRGILTPDVDYILDDASGQLYFTPALSAGETIDAAYTHFSGLIQQVQKVVDGDPLDRANYPGWRAAGVRVRVRTPQILQQVVQATLTIQEGYSSAAVQADVKAALSGYINGLGISGDVIRNELIAVIMGVSGVYNVSLVQPVSDAVMLDDQLPRVTSGNILLS